MTKQRRSIHLTQRQFDLLRDEAKRLDITVSDLLRRIIDRYFEGEVQ